MRAGPVHTVRQGESVMTLAKRWGVHPDSLREHPTTPTSGSAARPRTS